MAIKVYGTTHSTRTLRVLIVLEKLGLKYELQPINLQKGEHASPTYKADHHPFGKVPAIEDDGVKLFESRAISRYLVAKYPSNGSLSLPTSPAALGAFEQAASVEDAYFDPPVAKLGWEKIFKKIITGQDADAGTVAVLERDLKQVLDYYETVLAGSKWLAGDSLSLVDVFTWPWFGFLEKNLGYAAEIEARPNVAAYWKRAKEDAELKKVTAH